jgi:integrase
MKEGVCPECGRAQCHINLYYQGKVYKFYKDSHGIILSQMSAISMLQEINREMSDKNRPFDIHKWLNASFKERIIEKAVDNWILDCKAEVGRGEMSLSVPIFYRSIANCHILNKEYGLGKWLIEEVGVFEIKQFSKALPSKLKIATRRQILNVLHIFMTWAFKEGLIREIPAFPTIKGNDSRPRLALDIESQYEALTKIPEVHRDVYEWAFETGCRPGETCALKIKDCDFENKTVTIRRTFTMNRLRESDKEGHKKPIPLSERAFEIAKSRAAGRFPDEWLFINPQGRHYTQQNLNDIWKKFTGLEITHYEGSRHSFCTQIAEIADKKAAQSLMRHVAASSTDRYIHSRTEYLREHLEKRNNVVNLKKERK